MKKELVWDRVPEEITEEIAKSRNDIVYRYQPVIINRDLCFQLETKRDPFKACHYLTKNIGDTVSISTLLHFLETNEYKYTTVNSETETDEKFMKLVASCSKSKAL